MDRERFETLVARVVESLPEEFHTRLENIDVVVEDWPSQGQLAEVGLKRGATLLGLYEGVPLTRRSSHYGLVPPDKITVFQKPVEAKCRNDAEITAEIQRVVRHEIAHHFGIGDDRLEQLERVEDADLAGLGTSEVLHSQSDREVVVGAVDITLRDHQVGGLWRGGVVDDNIDSTR